MKIFSSGACRSTHLSYPFLCPFLVLIMTTSPKNKWVTGVLIADVPQQPLLNLTIPSAPVLHSAQL